MRKSPVLSTIIGTCVLALAVPSLAQAQTPQAYPLICNLPGTTVFFDHDGFSMSFSPATVGSRQRAPSRGQCAWQDRGIAAEEGGRLIWRAGERVLWRVLVHSDGSVRNVVANNGASQINQATLSNFYRAWRDGGTVTFMAYRERCESGGGACGPLLVRRVEW